MKKLILLLALIVPIVANAQFQLTSDGFKTSEGKDFYVVEIEGTQSQLFQRAQSAITEIFVSANDVVSANMPDIISLSGYTNAIFIKQVGKKTNMDTKYSMKILFKDGKIRFNAPTITSMGVFNNGRTVNLYMGCGGGSGMNDFGHIFKKDGSVRYNDAVNSSSEFFNSLINEIVEKINSPVTQDDW